MFVTLTRVYVGEGYAPLQTDEISVKAENIYQVIDCKNKDDVDGGVSFSYVYLNTNPSSVIKVLGSRKSILEKINRSSSKKILNG